MNQQIQETLSKMSQNLQVLTDFCNRYADALDDRSDIGGIAFNPYVKVYDAITAGNVFGKNDWVRERELYTIKIIYNWVRTIDGVKVIILGAEVQEDMNETPVPPKAFPIRIEENVRVIDDEIHF